MPLIIQSEGNLFAAASTLLALFLVIILAGLGARLVKLPYTSVLVLAGLALQLLPLPPQLNLTPEIVLIIFLPPLAFEAAFHLDFDRLREDLAAVTVFALFGVVVTMAVTALILVYGLGWNWEIALLFGALVAATDPVSVVAVFRELGVQRRLSTIIEAESLFNDGTTIVLFRIVLAVVALGNMNLQAGLVDFLRLVLGGILLGFVLGYLASRLLISIDDYLTEISATVILAWGSYLLGEYVGVSGIIVVVVAGLVLGNYGGRVSFSPTTKIVLAHVLEFVAFVANSFIFLLIGLQVKLADLGSNLLPILWAIPATLVARAVAIYALSLPLRVSNPIPLRWQHLLFWGGLRGGVTLALALSLPLNIPLRESLIVAAFGVVLFTLVVQGLTVKPLVRYLGLVPREESRREHETVRARLLAVRASERRLAVLREQSVVSAEVYESVSSQYAKRHEELAKELRDLHEQHPEITEDELRVARLESLRAERSALFDLNRRGSVSDEVYGGLIAEIDTQLHALSATSAEQRAAESGPDEPSDTEISE